MAEAHPFEPRASYHSMAEKRIDAEDGSAYTFQELSVYYKGKYKKKDGSWKKDGFKRAQAEAHRMTKKEMKK